MGKRILNGSDPLVKTMLVDMIENGLVKGVRIETHFFPLLAGRTTITIEMLTTVDTG